MSTDRAAFILRIAPGGDDLVEESVARSRIVIGWEEAYGLLDPALSYDEFRQIVHDTYYADEPNNRRAGNAAGQLWRFIRQMKEGDLVVVPHYSSFYVAEVTGAANKGLTDQGFYQRPVRWLNKGESIPRKSARAALQSRMKVYNSCANATDLIESIEECIELAAAGKRPDFHADLHARLVTQTLEEIRGGRMDSYGFETLIQALMMAMGAQSCPITARSKDFGADMVASFLLAGVFEMRVAIQAKHYYQPESPLQFTVVQEVIRGIERENANLGMVITAGTISQWAEEAAQRYYDEKGIKIELVDGAQFAALIVEQGLGAYRSARSAGS